MNKASFAHPVGRVRIVGWIEGISYLLLLGVAMPLKYLADLPMAVKIVGWAHGVLFVVLMLLILIAWIGKKLSFGHSALMVIASLLPFGPFFIDRKLAADESGD
ncbi:membrane protein YdzA [Haloferula helveola]|uniref:Membrane protein YdzA n=1 Tax=Haloferula helveola TaxID=490095 RepID=A0ABN6H6R2_9BACT|nr:membrane protein YdzA [Haloferula helveola]